MINKVEEKDRISFNKAAKHPLQSWEWGEFRKNAGNEIVRFGVYQDRTLIEAVQLFIHKIPKIPYKIGSLIKGPTPTQELLDELKKTALENLLLFIKIEPNSPALVNGKKQIQNDKVVKLLKKEGAVPGKTLFTPSTFWIDLTPPEDELLQSFHPKTRYNIRVALKHGVEVVEDNSPKAFEKYIELTRETVSRQGFYSHSEKYHRLMWKFLHTQPVENEQKPIARLLTARFKGEIITTWIVFVWHEFLYYPYGASTEKYKQVMANNLMMWEAIRYGKKLGLKTFDLWGREEGKGFTKFKEGYNPKVVEFLGTWDLVTSAFYRPYKIAENIRWKILKTKSKFVTPAF